MAISVSTPTDLERAWSLGPVKVQIKKFTLASGDTSGTITFDGLRSLSHVVITGVVLSAATTYSGNVATITVTNPAATVYCSAIAFGV